MVSVGNNMFYNVTLPVTLWFFDKGKKKTDRKDKILFIDARNIYQQIDRAHRDWTEEQIEQITDIVRSYRGEKDAKKYKDIKGLCKVAILDEVRAAGYSLNPGRYVGTADGEFVSDADFETTVRGLNTEFQKLTDEAHDLWISHYEIGLNPSNEYLNFVLLKYPTSSSVAASIS
jgi:type I restriction enzyme M protein